MASSRIGVKTTKSSEINSFLEVSVSGEVRTVAMRCGGYIIPCHCRTAFVAKEIATAAATIKAQLDREPRKNTEWKRKNTEWKRKNTERERNTRKENGKTRKTSKYFNREIHETHEIKCAFSCISWFSWFLIFRVFPFPFRVLPWFGLIARRFARWCRGF